MPPFGRGSNVKKKKKKGKEKDTGEGWNVAK